MSHLAQIKQSNKKKESESVLNADLTAFTVDFAQYAVLLNDHLRIFTQVV